MSTVMWTEEENKTEKPEREKSALMSANLFHSQVRIKSQSAEVQT